MASDATDPHDLLAMQLRRETREKTAQKEKAEAERKRKADEAAKKAADAKAERQLQRAVEQGPPSEKETLHCRPKVPI